MNVGDKVELQASSTKTIAATIEAIVPDRAGKDYLVFRLINGKLVVMPDTALTAKVIVWTSPQN